MKRVDADVLILGSGFGGSLLSLILNQLGKRCVLVDRSEHPRFAIGESSTPLADFILSDLAQRYGLADVAPLASFGSWQEKCPELRCGLKRGFTYFHHQPNRAFETDSENANQLLVAASSDAADSDTHWHRADVDAFLFGLARDSGVECLENTDIGRVRSGDRWRVAATHAGQQVQLTARFIVDATGAARVMHHQLGLEDITRILRTKSRAIFGHFDNVKPFADVLDAAGVSRDPHPYTCDAAALHHLLGDDDSSPAWMWNLRFTDGLVSAGIAIGEPTGAQLKPIADEWNEWLGSFPSIRDQFTAAVPAADIEMRRTSRLQRLSGAAGGEGWIALPNTVGFIDPLHSTGIAHTLSAVERIARMFERNEQPCGEAISAYATDVLSELRLIDELVSGCYAAMNNFKLFKTWCMLYFASAHSCEMRRIDGEPAFANGFLGASLSALASIVNELRRSLDQAIAENSVGATEGFEAEVREAIEPFNLARLLDPTVRNMYHNTAPPRGFGSVVVGQSQS